MTKCKCKFLKCQVSSNILFQNYLNERILFSITVVLDNNDSTGWVTSLQSATCIV